MSIEPIIAINMLLSKEKWARAECISVCGIRLHTVCSTSNTNTIIGMFVDEMSAK